MEVGIAELRRELKDYLERVRAGDEVIVTERGRPVARISRIDSGPLIDRLTTAGIVSRPAAPTRAQMTREGRIRPAGSVSDLVIEDRDRRR